MTRPDQRALLILAVVGVVSVVFLYFELTSGGSAQPAEDSVSIGESEPERSVAGEQHCEYFFSALQPVSHTSLSVHDGAFVSEWDGSEYRGCEVQFETHDSLPRTAPVPDFDALPDSEMYRVGWRMSEGIGADGAGSGIFGIEKDSVLCIVRWARPAYLADDGGIVKSETFSMTIQCRTDAGAQPQPENSQRSSVDSAVD
ncbi:MAG: hypothetical protein E4H28_04380 [Gemmatimonadales bacterium]|nr:MAG: hypothetical protein E4H28_04380 [Gemmatimonadales bacterium]